MTPGELQRLLRDCVRDNFHWDINVEGIDRINVRIYDGRFEGDFRVRYDSTEQDVLSDYYRIERDIYDARYRRMRPRYVRDYGSRQDRQSRFNPRFAYATFEVSQEEMEAARREQRSDYSDAMRYATSLAQTNAMQYAMSFAETSREVTRVASEIPAPVSQRGLPPIPKNVPAPPPKLTAPTPDDTRIRFSLLELDDEKKHEAEPQLDCTLRFKLLEYE